MKIVVTLLSLLIAIILGIVYVKISTPEIKSEVKTTQSEKKEVKKEPNFKITNEFNFPARIAYMRVDFKDVRYIELYKVEIDVNDKYTLFNVKELLKSNKVPFSMVEDKKGIKIYILFRDLTQADKVINLFKEYNFKIKLQKIKQRI